MPPNDGVVQQKAAAYFKQMSPLAGKLSADIDLITDTYAHLWHNFTADEKFDIINVTLIKPELVLKYYNDFGDVKKRRSSAMLSKDGTTIITDTDSNDDRRDSVSSANSNSYRSNDFSHIYLYNGKDVCTYGQIITALRYNQDDLCGIYRDEHSEPFNHKTKSQMNLSGGNAADASAKFQRAQKMYPEIKLPFSNGLDAIEGIKMPGVDHMPELSMKLASLNKARAAESNQDGSVVRRSFMSKLFNSKTNAVPVKVSSNPRSAAPVDVSAIDLGIDTGKDFDSMSTKSAGSHVLKADEHSDRSRLIDDDDDNGNDVSGNADADKAALDFDFLNNW